MRVYVAYRYSANNVLGVLSNIGKAIDIGHELAQIEGVYPFIPHLDCLVAMRSPQLSLEYYYKSSMEFLKVCDVMFLVDISDLDTSKGVKEEYDCCIDRGIPVIRDVESLVKLIEERNSNDQTVGN